ncbi:glycosyltransferase [Leptospira sp. GIMC2001]|uniref:glycosyltransferase n=1 Tax=Leptospira sp. GIMC2001 TaxID=1513297 RepID=UPI0023490A6D|nr:glycosyltransferase [Leptospira sp. GIMC2001]WCL51276.1 glycosyltransferase [Leptospira sp. GIMC2001]
MKNIYDISNLDRVKEIENDRNLEYSSKIIGLSIVILNLDKPNFIIPLLECLDRQNAIFNDKHISFEVIIGDTGSSNTQVLEYYDKLKENFIVVRNLKYHFSKNNNYLAYNYAKYDTILFLNNDTLLEKSDSLFNIYNSLNIDKKLGIAGPVLLFENKRIQHAGIDFYYDERMDGFFPYHKNGNEKIESIKHYKELTPFAAVTGAFLMIKWSLFEKVQGFDEFYNKEGQDIDLCMKIKRLGYKIILTNFGTIYHFENGTRVKGEEDSSDRKRLVRKWNNFIKYGLTI